MEIQLIFGPNSSGKSLYAETLATTYHPCPLFYIATMIPHTEENFSRIEKHKLQRAGKGFTTIEESWNIDQLNIPSDAVVLLEDASNLLANGIFNHQKNASECFEKIIALANQCKKLIIVSITGLTCGDYDDATNDYITQLNTLNEHLKTIATDCKQFS